MRERPVGDVPGPVKTLLGLALAAQIAWHALGPEPVAEAASLPAPPGQGVLDVAALGDRPVLARALMLWLQAFDNQPGISVPFAQLDYQRVQAWLDAILALDPRSHYPLLAAARVYSNVPIESKKRAMLDWVYERFMEDPDGRWQWLAHAAIVANHQLHDLALALRYARAITEHATAPEVPAWARDMSAIVLEEMGEVEAARIVVGGLLESGRITDPNELRFLIRKLEALEAASANDAEGG